MGCLSSGTDATINAALVGRGAQVALCPRAVFTLSRPVQFTAPGQQLYTQGLPVDGSRATLVIASPSLTTAVQAFQSDIVIRNIQLDGNRRALGALDGGALLQLGAGVAQTVRFIVARDTRSWSTIHVFEGLVTNDVPQCQRATITDNVIGPAGTPTKWADGISLACGNSLVANNVVTDATDGAIVVFGAPGSLVQNNTIVAASRTLLGGINLVDYAPVHGNFTGTRVMNNTIEARGAFIKIGIAMGLDTWTCSGTTVYGASVTGNVLKGLHMGYGYAVNGVSSFTVTGNVDLSRHVGVPGAGCGGTPAAPAAFQYQRVTASTLQPEFKAASLTYLLAVSEPSILSVLQPVTGCGVILPDQGLAYPQTYFSCDGRFRLVLQTDSNLVLYQGAAVLWASNTVGRNAAQAIMQRDGNFVLYDTQGRPFWATNTLSPGAHARLQDDGNFAIYSSAGVALWSTQTGGR